MNESHDPTDDTAASPPNDSDGGTPAAAPTKVPDAELRLTDAGLELPDHLRGYTGKFTIRTPSVTGTLRTTDTGLPDAEFWDGSIASYPGAGDYHGDLREGLLAISIPDYGETVYEIVDQRSDADGDADE